MFAGSSGAGKSTISALLQGSLRPTRGCISLNGIDLATVPLSWVRAQTTIAEQSIYLFFGTLHDNLSLTSPTTTDDRLTRAPRAAYLGKFVSILPGGLNVHIGARSLTIFGGEAQRIAVAHAFLKSASIMTLGELTAHMDLASKREIFIPLETVCARCTALTTSHQDATIRDFDHIVILREGMIR